MYRCCKQKHAITEDFDTNEDFVTKDEGTILEALFLGIGKANKRVRTINIGGDEAIPASVSSPSDLSLREEVAPCLDEVSLLCHVGDAPSLVAMTGNQDNPKNTLGRIDELEPLPTSLDLITHIGNLG